jgi:hypothetical protein
VLADSCQQVGAKKEYRMGHYIKNLPGIGLMARVGDLMN